MWNHFSRDRETLIWLGAVSAALFVGSLLLVPLLMVRMRDDYFMPGSAAAETQVRRHPVLYWIWLLLKNLIGLLLVLAGVSMLLLPGQGILTILLGLAFLSFPGKRALELRLLRVRGVRRGIDAIRAHYGRAPLRLPASEPPPGGGR